MKRLILLLVVLCCIGVVSGATYITDTYMNIDYINADTGDIIHLNDTTEVNGNAIVSGNLTVYGDSHVNLDHGGMWNYSANASAWSFTIGAAGVYYNITGLAEGDVNGMNMTCNATATGGCYLVVQHSGTYLASAQVSAISVTSGALFSLAIVEDFDVGNHRDCYARRDLTQLAVGSFGISCFMDLDDGDFVNLQIENEENTNNILFHTINVVLLRVGD